MHTLILADATSKNVAAIAAGDSGYDLHVTEDGKWAQSIRFAPTSDETAYRPQAAMIPLWLQDERNMKVVSTYLFSL